LINPAKKAITSTKLIGIKVNFAGRPSLIKLVEYYEQGNWLLVSLDIVVLVVSVLVMLEAWSVITRLRKDNATHKQTQ
ncbi:MAG: carbon starvation protein A, partial [Pseudomonadota bacterium]